MKKGFFILGLLIVTAAVPVMTSLPAYADERGITPYGDYCRDCSQYGACKEALPPREAVKAVDKYYKDRGYNVGAVKHKGRFIEADIYKDNRQVDRVVLDRKTGRLRSTY